MSTTAKPVRGPAETPLGALKPAGSAPVESHARGTVRRKPVIRFHARMVRGKLYPLVVQLRDEDGRGGGVAINGDGSHGGTVTVLPVIPGALVSPASVEMSTGSGSESRFWVTPLSLGKLRDARVEFRQGARVIESVPLVRSPDWLLVILGLVLTAGIVPILYFLSFSRYIKVRRGWLPWIMLFLAFLLPTLLFMAKRHQWDVTATLIDDKPRPESVRSLIDTERKDAEKAEPAKPVEESGVINPPAGADPGAADKPKSEAEKLKPADDKKDDKKPAEEKKDADKPKSEDGSKPDPKKDAEDKSKPAEKDKPSAAEQDTADDLQAVDEDKPKDEKKPEAAPTSPPPTNQPATKTGGGNRGGGRGGRGAGGGGQPGGGGGGGGMMQLPPAPPGAGKPPVMVTYRGSQAIEKWLNQQQTMRETSALSDLDTRDIAILGLVQLKPVFTETYTWAYDFPRNLQYSEVFLFGVLMVLTIAYWGLFGPVRARVFGRAVEMPAG